MSTKLWPPSVLPPPPGGEGWGEGVSAQFKSARSSYIRLANLPLCSLSLGERVGVRDCALDPSLDGSETPSPLTPPPRGEGNRTGFARTLIAVATLCNSLAHAQAPDPALEARVKALSSELRCLVCQNQTVEDSSSPVARDMKDQVRTQLAAGKSEAEVKIYMTDRFGDFVLYKPPLKATTIVLWAGPFIALFFAGLLLVRRLRRSSVATDTGLGTGVDALSETDRARARALLHNNAEGATKP
jgi:cytochrome c-type biogenesis protein CcmH